MITFFFSSTFYCYRYNNEELAIEICAMTALGITHTGGIADPLIRDKTSRLLLKLAKWLSADLVCSDSTLAFASCPTIQKLLSMLKHNITPSNNSSAFEILSMYCSCPLLAMNSHQQPKHYSCVLTGLLLRCRLRLFKDGYPGKGCHRWKSAAGVRGAESDVGQGVESVRQLVL